MGDWADSIGNFKSLQAVGVRNLLGKCAYLTIVKIKDDHLSNENSDENHLYMFETLQMALAPKGKDAPKFTYKGEKTVKDKKTGKSTKLQNQDLPMKKFVTITFEAKAGLTFLLNMFVKECHAYYKSKGYKFGPDDKVLQNIMDFADSLAPDAIVAPAIIRAGDAMDPDQIVPNNFGNIQTELQNKITPLFKDEEGKTPDTKVEILVKAFVKFLKVISIMSGDDLYHKRAAVNKSYLLGKLRMLNSFIKMYGACFEQEVLDTMSQYIDATKPPAKEGGKGKKKKSEDGEDEEADGDDDADDLDGVDLDDDDDADEDKKEKSPPAKPSAPKKPTAKGGKPAAPAEPKNKAAPKKPGRPPGKGAAKTSKKTSASKDDDANDEFDNFDESANLDD